MTIEKLRHAHRTVPFKPFDINLADGRSLPVHHPEVLAISPTGRTVTVELPNGGTEIVDLLLVTTLSWDTNGHEPPRRRRQR